MAVSTIRTARTAETQTIYENAADAAKSLNPEDPVFLFSARQLAGKAQEFLTGFPGETTFAVKSNPSREVIGTLAESGLRRWDVASVQEMAAVRSVSRKAQFNYHNPVKSKFEIGEAYNKFGCRRFAVDCREELRKIAAITGSSREIEIAVRLVLPRERTSSAHDFSTKFGAPEHICIDLLKEATLLGFTPMLTFHPGSQAVEPQTYTRHIRAAARVAEAAGVKISKLNVGGGFPASYPLSKTPPLQVFFATIARAASEAFGHGNEPKLECEPGRGLVATSTSLLTRIKLVCTDGDDIFINDGVYGGLMECMQVHELMPSYRAIRDGGILRGETKAWKTFGPTCDPIDVLPFRLDLPAELREDDFIEFGSLGAYGLSTITRFNGYGEHRIVPVSEALMN